MKKIICLGILILLFKIDSFAQVGIGGGGGLNYPGFSSSDLYNSQFKIGAGYDIFIRHRLIKLSDNHILHAKYSVSNYFSDIDLARVGITRFNFSYLSVEVFTPVYKLNSYNLILGAGLNLINATTTQRYFESNESLLIPSVSFGTEYWFNKSYNIFSIFNFQFGEFEDNGQNLPIHGLRFQLGATMFFTE